MNSFLGAHREETLPSSGGSGNETHQNHFRVLCVQGKGKKNGGCKDTGNMWGFCSLEFSEVRDHIELRLTWNSCVNFP